MAKKTNDNIECQITERDAYDLAWKYFQYHAQQRISFFSFYLVYIGVLTTVIAGVYSAGKFYVTGIIFSFLIVVFSYLFFKLDQRNNKLTDCAKTVIREFEKKYNFSPDIKYMNEIKMFTKIQETSKNPNKKRVYTHHTMFKIIFITFAVLGGISTIFSIILQSNLKN